MSKMGFANTINEMGKYGVKGAGDCHNFGITYGCQSDCPAFENGECADVYGENIERFFKDGDIDIDEVNEYIELYKITGNDKIKLLSNCT